MSLRTMHDGVTATGDWHAGVRGAAVSTCRPLLPPAV